MPFFAYRARDKDGALHTGSLEAPDMGSVEASIEMMGLIPVHVVPQRKPLKLTTIKYLFGGIPPQDLILFSRQIATLYAAGVPLTKALGTLEKQMEHPKFVRIIKRVREDVEGGSTFTEALSRHPQVFGDLYSSMVEAGEAGGILEETLERMADMLERNAETKAKVKSATLYPKLVLGAIVIAIAILMTFVVPKFVQIYSSFDVPLPWPTRLLISISNAFQSYWYLVAGGAFLIFMAVRAYISTEKGSYNRDWLVLKVPIFGPLILKSILSRGSRVLGALYRSGLPILRSLDMTSKAVGNKVLAESFKVVEAEVREGKSLAEPMAAMKLFPPLVVQMIAVGEETGNLDEMLEKTAQYYDREVDNTLRNLTTLIEPILLGVVFVIVLFLAMAIFLPMWDILKIVRK
ncbi:MAG: type II secretion system F family protein [Thermodesulfobacteriota bacterium]